MDEQEKQQILESLKQELKRRKEITKQTLKPGENKLKYLYEQCQILYIRAVNYYKLKDIEQALLCYELANHRYSYYLSIRNNMRKNIQNRK